MQESQKPPILVNTADAARLLALSASHLEKLRFYRDSHGPPYVRLGRAIRYRISDLEAWAAARVRESQQ
ncbi:DNA-binding protein [Mesorhizobium sp. USDA-HM6]|nr:DNA-binding protein [Mesorhizobium sp. USDA-HM6]